MTIHKYTWGKPRQSTAFMALSSPACGRQGTAMGFEITLIDSTSEHVDAADGYALEGPLTTFFRTAPGRTPRLDPWSERVLSVRTERIAMIRPVPVTVTMSSSLRSVS